jgi:hypothetical protein
MKKSAGFVGLGLALGAGIGAATGNVETVVAWGVVFGAAIGAAKTKRDVHLRIQAETLTVMQWRA